MAETDLEYYNLLYKLWLKQERVKGISERKGSSLMQVESGSIGKSEVPHEKYKLHWRLTCEDKTSGNFKSEVATQCDVDFRNAKEVAC